MNDNVSRQTNRQILLVEKPTGKLGPEHFRMSNGAIPEPKDGEALLRVRYISLDAANRAWMHGATYRAAVEANTVMAGGGIAEVVSSKAPGLAPGDIVFGDTGWQEYAAVPARQLAKMPKVEPMTHLLSVYGIAGLTAYFGLLDIGKPKAGETVVVSAAAGLAAGSAGAVSALLVSVLLLSALGSAAASTARTALWQPGARLDMFFCRHCSDAMPPGGTLAQCAS